MAIPIISVGGPADGFNLVSDLQALAVEWSQVAPARVEIAIEFMDATFNGPVAYSAYIMNQIGAGTTAANEEAAATFLATTPDSLTLSRFVLFPDIVLNAGTHYLVVGMNPALNPNLFPEGYWGSTTLPTILTAPGAADLGQYFANTLDLYLPASGFVLDETGTVPEESELSRLLYDVQTVPEPSTLLLALGPLLGLIVLKLRQR